VRGSNRHAKAFEGVEYDYHRTSSRKQLGRNSGNRNQFSADITFGVSA
jgi:hypothetical protein